MLIIIALILIAGWTAAWLHWMFDGDIRRFLFAKVFPTSWRGGREPTDIMLMSGEEFMMFLGIESSAPAFVNGVLSCPACSSAYVSAVGIVLALFGGILTCNLLAVPLVWAAAAWAGHRLHKHL